MAVNKEDILEDSVHVISIKKMDNSYTFCLVINGEIIQESVNPFDLFPNDIKKLSIEYVREQEEKPMYWTSLISVVVDSINRMGDPDYVAFCQQYGCKGKPTLNKTKVGKNYVGSEYKMFCEKCEDEWEKKDG